MNNMTDREFLNMMIEKYHIEDFDDASRMCDILYRYARIAIEISEADNHKYGKDCEKELESAAGKLSICSDIFRRAYLDEI